MTAREYFLEMCGYELQTTFWDDFTIADHFGKEAIIDTFQRAFKEWKHDYKYMTELTLVLSHKIWQHYDYKEIICPLAQLYNDIFEDCYNWCVKNLKGEELKYFYRITD